MRQLWKLRTTARAVVMAAAVSMATGPAGAGFALAHGHDSDTTTPIEHLVVIFQENVSFDHYFATYPTRPILRASLSSMPTRDTPTVNGLDRRPADEQSQSTIRPTAPARSTRSASTAPRRQPATRTTTIRHEQKASTTGLMDLFSGHRRHAATRRCAAEFAYGKAKRPGDGLLRRQHRHRAVELRAALRDERQLLRHHVRSVDARRARTWSPARPTASARPTDRHASRPRRLVDGQRRRHADRRPRPGVDDCLLRRHVAAPRSLMTRPEHRRPAQRRGRHLGLVPGRLRPHRRRNADGSARGLRPQHGIPSNGSARPSSTTSRTTNPFQYYASTANPHHLPADRHVATMIGTRRSGQPRVRPRMTSAPR